MRKEFGPWQRAALAHPHDAENGPDRACMHVPRKGHSVCLTCDIDEETAQVFGGRCGMCRSGRRVGRGPKRCSPA